MKKTHLAVAVLAAAHLAAVSRADTVTRADTHAPIGVMAEHYHKKGEWMLSYRLMTMSMEGSRVGSSGISPDEIVTTIPNRFFGLPMQPPTLRIVPTEMTMNMHMFGLMYAPSDRLTLMAMLNYLDNDMDHLTYQGGMGTNVLGQFTTESSGIADASIAALVSFIDRPDVRIHGILGLSIPVGSVNETDDVLTPMGGQPIIRLPYPMQLGSGSWDPIVGVSYSGFRGQYAWGGQWRSTFRFADNDESYRLGNDHRLTGWLSYRFVDAFSVSLRAEYRDWERISGIDPVIVGPVQTADPRRQGGNRLDVGLGANVALQGNLSGWRIAVEYMSPVAQDLRGPQLRTDDVLTLGVQKSW